MQFQSWLHILSFYKDAPTCSTYQGYQYILPSSQQILMSGFDLNSTSDFLVLIGSFKVCFICKVMMNLGSAKPSVG